jgi:hypothetical protein
MRFSTCSSSTKSSSTACWAPMSSTSIKPDHIKGSGNRFQNRMVDLFHQIMIVATSFPSRSWVDYTTTTAEVHKLFQRRRGDCLRHVEHLRKIFHLGSFVENQQAVVYRFPRNKKHTREMCASSSVSCYQRGQERFSRA